MANKEIEHLRLERRSLIAASLLILAIFMIAGFVLLLPALRLHAGLGFRATLAREEALVAQSPLYSILNLITTLALFFLNVRYSFLLRRPAWGWSGWLGRSAWFLILVFCAMTPLFDLAPLALLAYWGKQAIRQRENEAHVE